MMINVLNAGLGLALLLFAVGFILGRNRVQPLHRVFTVTATLLTVAIGVALIVMVRMVHAGNLHGAGIALAEGVDSWMVITHRICASIVFLWMGYMAWAGYRRKTALHGAMAPWFLISYSLVYFSGMMLFRSL